MLETESRVVVLIRVARPEAWRRAWIFHLLATPIEILGVPPSSMCTTNGQSLIPGFSLRKTQHLFQHVAVLRERAAVAFEVGRAGLQGVRQ